MAAVIGFFVASAIVTLLQFLRVKDRRLLPLLALFTLRAVARFLGETSATGVVADLLAGCAALALLYWLSPRQAHTANR
jgi:xanthine/uracil permease